MPIRSRGRLKEALYYILSSRYRDLDNVERTMVEVDKCFVFNDIADRLNEGKSIKEIAEFYGTNENIIKAIADELRT